MPGDRRLLLGEDGPCLKKVRESGGCWSLIDTATKFLSPECHQISISKIDHPPAVEVSLKRAYHLADRGSVSGALGEMLLVGEEGVLVAKAAAQLLQPLQPLEDLGGAELGYLKHDGGLDGQGYDVGVINGGWAPPRRQYHGVEVVLSVKLSAMALPVKHGYPVQWVQPGTVRMPSSPSAGRAWGKVAPMGLGRCGDRVATSLLRPIASRNGSARVRRVSHAPIPNENDRK